MATKQGHQHIPNGTVYNNLLRFPVYNNLLCFPVYNNLASLLDLHQLQLKMRDKNHQPNGADKN